jgi:hypothetical protein
MFCLVCLVTIDFLFPSKHFPKGQPSDPQMWCQNSGRLRTHGSLRLETLLSASDQLASICGERKACIIICTYIHTHSQEIPSMKRENKKVMNGLILFASKFFHTLSRFILELGALIYFTCIRISISAAVLLFY